MALWQYPCKKTHHHMKLSLQKFQSTIIMISDSHKHHERMLADTLASLIGGETSNSRNSVYIGDDNIQLDKEAEEGLCQSDLKSHRKVGVNFLQKLLQVLETMKISDMSCTN